jgi:FtsP/CotA-like multicopper oxidase with cupredoxin domain
LNNNLHSVRLCPLPQTKLALMLKLALALPLTAVGFSAHAGAGFGDSSNPSGADIRVPTFYAHSPSGFRNDVPVECKPPLTNAVMLANCNYGFTGYALRKFVDPLPLMGAQNSRTMADGTVKYIPVAKSEKWVRTVGVAAPVPTNDDYYEIAVIEYKEKLHSDLRKPTLLRGYVQLWTPTLGVPKKTITLSTGATLDVVDDPHYLGPAINATKGVAIRLKFVNLLPAGSRTGADRKGDLFIPVDETLAGAGYGPDGETKYSQNRASLHLHGGDSPWISDGTPHQWIAPAAQRGVFNSVTPAIADVNHFMKGASAKNVPDMPDPGEGAQTYYFPNNQTGRMMWYHDHTYGLTRLNVYSGQAAPYFIQDAAQDALLAATPGFPTAAETIPLIIQDKTFVPDDIKLQDARWNANAQGVPTPAWGEAGDLWYPHVYEFNQDPNNGVDGTSPVGRWDWGPYFWPVFPALYNVPSGAVDDVTITPEAWMDTPLVNGVAYPSLSVDPKAYRFKILNGANDRFFNLSIFVANEDSSVFKVNVTAGGEGYSATNPPTVTFGPPDLATGVRAEGKAVVEDIVVAGVPKLGVVTRILVTNPGSGYMAPTTISIDATGASTGAIAGVTMIQGTEVPMVQASTTRAGLPACTTDDPADPSFQLNPGGANACWPAIWPIDGRDGGVPDPRSAGPKMLVIGNEGGLLPQVSGIAATPMGYEFNRRSVTVLNTFTHGLFMGNAERADVVVDFSAYAGKTLILYNDSPAPVPAFDPRNDHYTGKADESGVGSIESPKAGYGPNTRTIMQIKVANTTPVPLDAAALRTNVSLAYGQTQDRPIVGQKQYAAAFTDGSSWTDTAAGGVKAFANIFTGTLQEPAFNFAPGSPGLFKGAKVTNGGSGYQTVPTVTVSAPPTLGDPGSTAALATAVATLRLDKVNLTNAGSGYLVAPTVSFLSTSGGFGATAVASLKILSATTTATGGNGANQGNGYTSVPNVRVSVPTRPTIANGGVQAKVTAVVTNGRVTGLTIVEPGSGYPSPPILTIDAPTGANPRTAKAVVTAGVADVRLVSPNPSMPNLVGGGGYTNMSNVTVTIAAPARGTTATATVTGAVLDVAVTSPGSGYTTVPTLTIAAPVAPANSPVGQTYTPALANLVTNGSILVKNKAIQELFDPTYGRMNATLGIELPFTSALAQTTIPLGYVDPLTEEINDGETQIWKITHNGVDAHPVHFHLVNVQIINRVGWDGTIKPPLPHEYGWKETVRMNPLEDIIVAIKAKKPVLPGFGVPLSIRPRDPSQPIGTPAGFTQVDPVSGQPATIFNQVDNYGWEYVWHCHILGHEENDFMRPVKFNAGEAKPLTPTNVTLNKSGANYTFSWNDVSQTEYQYVVKRALVTALPVPTMFPATGVTVATLPANSSTFTDTTAPAPGAGQTYMYEVSAVGAAGISKAVEVNGLQVADPTNVVVTVGSNGRGTVTWTDNAVNETQTVIQIVEVVPNAAADAPVVWTDVGTIPSTAALSTTTGLRTYAMPATTVLVQGKTYLVRAVSQILSSGLVAATQSSTPYTLVMAGPVPPTAVTATVLSGQRATIAWNDASNNEARFLVEVSTDGTNWTPAPGATTGVVTSSAANSLATPRAVTYVATGLVAGNTYQFRVSAQMVNGVAVAATNASIVSVLDYKLPTAPTALTVVDVFRGTGTAGNGVPVISDRVTLNWVAPVTTQFGVAPVSYVVDWSATADFAVIAGTTALVPAASNTTFFNVARGTGPVTQTVGTPAAYWFRIRSVNLVGTSANSTDVVTAATK